MTELNRQNKNNNKKLLLTLIIAALCALIFSFVTFSLITTDKAPDTPSAPENTTEADTTAVPEGPYIESTVTIGSAGDVLIHMPVMESAKQSDGTYNFDKLFTYVSDTIKDCDYFVANLETTLAGTENGRKYTSYPCFNSPDAIATALKKAGVDCLLTANNHTFDTRGHGVKRTISVVKEKGFDFVGTRENETDKRYLMKEISGINFGITCYTYETENANGKALNGILTDSETAKIINSFDYTNISAFYEDISEDLANMKKENADITIVYLHWGNEYQLTQNDHQEKIAQALCEMGVDVIIGGHPHVVQPVDLITSEDGTHSTVCVYSVGNFVSNQRRNLMGLKTGHTEDGLIFKMTFSKYSDGTVVFEKVRSIPTWVHLYSGNYNIVPLTRSLDGKASALGLTKSSSGLSLAQDSYERTMDLVKKGTKECNEYLSSLPRPDDHEEKITVEPTTDIAA